MKALKINLLLSILTLNTSCNYNAMDFTGSWYYINSSGEYHEVYFYNDQFTFNIESLGNGHSLYYEVRNDTIVIKDQKNKYQLDVKYLLSDTSIYALRNTGKYQLNKLPETINPWKEDTNIVVEDFVTRLYLIKFNKGILSKIDTGYLLTRFSNDSLLLKRALEKYTNIESTTYKKSQH